MEFFGKQQIVINDGAKVRPDWTDRIAISYLPESGKTPIFDSVIAKDIDNHSDLSGQTLTVLPVVFCGRAWETRNEAGNLVVFEYIEDMIASKVGRYSIKIYQTLVLAPSEINMYLGNTRDVLVWRYVAGAQESYADYDINITLGDNAALIGNESTGTLDYFRNVIYRGNETELVLANTEAPIIFDDTFMHNLPEVYDGNNNTVTGSHTRFYIKELGCYTLGSELYYFIPESDDDDSDDSDADIDPQEGRYPVRYQDLTSDYQLKKSTIKGIDKVNSGGKYYIEIKFKGGCEKIEMGTVWNKPEWTNNVAGQNTAYNEISEWLI
jgi:hypothetical protein